MLSAKRQPFTVTFNSDEYEFTTNEAAKGNKGYKLYYFQSSNGC